MLSLQELCVITATIIYWNWHIWKEEACGGPGVPRKIDSFWGTFFLSYYLIILTLTSNMNANMNANINANINANTLIGDNALHGHNKPTRVKKPALPAKANNLLVFSFWLIETLQHNHLLHDKDAAFKFIQLFNDVPSQLSFFNSFFDDFKLSHKLLKNTIKFAAKNAKQPTSVVTDKKTAALNATNTLLDAIPPIMAEEEEPAVKKRVYNRKPKAVTTEEAAVPGTEVEPPAVKKRTYNRKPKAVTTEEVVVPVPVPTQVPVPVPAQVLAEAVNNDDEDKEKDEDKGEEDEEDDTIEIEATPFEFDNQHFLIDKDNNLYHTTSFEVLGKFDATLKQLVLN